MFLHESNGAIATPYGEQYAWLYANGHPQSVPAVIYKNLYFDADPSAIKSSYVLRYSIHSFFTNLATADNFCGVTVMYNGYILEGFAIRSWAQEWEDRTIALPSNLVAGAYGELRWVLNCAQAGPDGGTDLYFDNVSVQYQRVGECPVEVVPDWAPNW